MSAILKDAKKLYSFKYKKRDDSTTDQYSRIFMMKAMLVATMVTGVQWYNDQIVCMVPSLAGKAVGPFSGRACWINGFYIYDELRHIQNFEGYYGMPTNTKHNGSYLDGNNLVTCMVQDGGKCQAMQKKFYIQYQWFPFLMAALATFYYLPYLLFGIANGDLKDLKSEIKAADIDEDKIIRSFFEHSDKEATKKQKLNVALNIFIKIAYIAANVLVFVVTNNVLNGDFTKFGPRWISWGRRTNYDAHNYVDTREFSKPGELLLPTFGFCDILEEGLDIKHALINEHKFVCEISQHVLYHYVLIAMWFLIIIGIVMSVVGLLKLLINYATWEIAYGKDQEKSKIVHKYLTIRQGEYLMFIEKKNIITYGKLLTKLYEKYKHYPSRGNENVPFDNMGKRDMSNGNSTERF